MADGFDTHELDDFAKEMMSLANDKMPKESKKIVQKEAKKLNTINKNVYKSKGIGIFPDDTPENKKIVNRFNAGKPYKYNGDVLSCRAYNSAPHAHLLNSGWTWTPHKGAKGTEHWVPGFHFIEDAAGQFEGTYYNDMEQFITDMIEKGL